MKTTILSIAFATILFSCTSEPATDKVLVESTIVTSDTLGLAQFQEWKDRQERESSDEHQQTFETEGVSDPAPVNDVKPAPVIIYRNVPLKQRVAKSTKVARTPKPVSTGKSREAYGRGDAEEKTSQGSGTTASDEGDVAVSQPAEVPAKKEGWSKAAKGTAIGGASGAVVGAVISKNKTKGAVIGGVVGAAGGYIYGRSQDKKDGRY